MTENEVRDLLENSFPFCFFIFLVSSALYQKFKIKFLKNVPLYAFASIFISLQI